MTTRERVRENKVEKECVQVVNWYRTEKHIDVRQLLNIGVKKNNDHLYHIHNIIAGHCEIKIIFYELMPSYHHQAWWMCMMKFLKY